MADAPGLSLRIAQASPMRLDAALECAPGEVVALVGPSGSGKTSILRAIAGLLRPREGRIACAGEVWLDTAAGIDRRPQARRVGMVFQEYALFPHLTAAENVMEALLDRPAAERRARALALLERVRLAGLERRKPAALSGGQRQRVAVARALARDPAALLLDEPFSAVDRATRERLYRELAELRAELRMPVVLVTHDLTEAAMLADRLVILSHGRTLQTGAPGHVMTRPDSPHIARLLGLKNVFEATVVEHRPERGLSILAWGSRRLEAHHQPDHPVGTQVAWVIPQAAVLLHRRDRPSRGERENPVTGVVSAFLTLGPDVAVTIDVDGVPGRSLHMQIPVHVAARNRVARGEPVTVSLLADSLHVMRREADPGTE